MIGLAWALAGTAAVTDLAWLAGPWRTEAADGRWTEELWTAPEAGSMLGVGRSVRGGETRSFDYMRIAADATAGLAFYGSPNGAAAVRFPLASSQELRIEFANPAHDYPQRIAYERVGDTLVATISLMDGSKRVSWTYRRR